MACEVKQAGKEELADQQRSGIDVVQGPPSPARRFRRGHSPSGRRQPNPLAVTALDGRMTEQQRPQRPLPQPTETGTPASQGFAGGDGSRRHQGTVRACQNHLPDPQTPIPRQSQPLGFAGEGAPGTLIQNLHPDVPGDGLQTRGQRTGLGKPIADPGGNLTDPGMTGREPVEVFGEQTAVATDGQGLSTNVKHRRNGPPATARNRASGECAPAPRAPPIAPLPGPGEEAPGPAPDRPF